MLTKEKSNQKRKSVNNQNNSVSYFRLLTLNLHHHYFLLKFQLRKPEKWSYEWVVLNADNVKIEGGWSLEQIDPKNPCQGKERTCLCQYTHWVRSQNV